MNKIFWILMLLTVTMSGCQGNHSESNTPKSIDNEKEAVTVHSSNNIKDIGNKSVILYGGDTFDPELKIKVNNHGLFDSKTNLSIVEDGENVFVFWDTGNYEKSGFSGSIASNGKWEVIDKNIFSSQIFSNWQRFDNYLLTIDDIGTWTEKQFQIGIRKILGDGTLSKDEIIAKAPVVSTINIVPTSHGKVVIYSSDDNRKKNDITFHLIPIEDKSIDIHSITYKQFPEGGIKEIKYIDFTNKNIYGIGKVSKGLLQVSMVSGEPLYDNKGKEKVAEVGEPVYISSNNKGEIEVYWNDDVNLNKSIFNKNLNQISKNVLDTKNNLITVKGNLLHYWEVNLYKNRPSLNLKTINN
jgi:hypothetical protein